MDFGFYFVRFPDIKLCSGAENYFSAPENYFSVLENQLSAPENYFRYGSDEVYYGMSTSSYRRSVK